MKHAISIGSTSAALVAGAALILSAVVTGAVGGPTPSHAAVRPAPKSTQQQIAALFDQWNAALQTGDPQKVADRYAPDAVLLPTASPQIRTDRAQIVDYFTKFLKRKPVGEKTRTIIKVLDRDSAIDTGLYRFTFTEADGTKTTTAARYTYEYEKRGGKWLIVNHHSSVLPPTS